MNILESIKKTIRYSEKYKSCLNNKQLINRLIGNKVYTKNEIINKVFEIGIEKKIVENKINPIVTIKYKKADYLAKKISKKFKDILFLGITGSVAAEFPKKNDDIDLIIIVKANKLWVTRLKLRFFISLNEIPHRRFGKKSKKDDFCFNLWLDEKSLKIDKKRQNLKNAIDLVLIKPLINKNNTYEKFILANGWAKKYVATGYYQKIKNLKSKKYNFDVNENLIDKIINFGVFWPQYWYMKRRIRNEIVGLHKAFFHH